MIELRLKEGFIHVSGVKTFSLSEVTIEKFERKEISDNEKEIEIEKKCCDCAICESQSDARCMLSILSLPASCLRSTLLCEPTLTSCRERTHDHGLCSIRFAVNFLDDTGIQCHHMYPWPAPLLRWNSGSVNGLPTYPFCFSPLGPTDAWNYRLMTRRVQQPQIHHRQRATKIPRKSRVMIRLSYQWRHGCAWPIRTCELELSSMSIHL
jgi:hypothetical protein